MAQNFIPLFNRTIFFSPKHINRAINISLRSHFDQTSKYSLCLFSCLMRCKLWISQSHYIHPCHFLLPQGKKSKSESFKINSNYKATATNNYEFYDHYHSYKPGTTACRATHSWPSKDVLASVTCRSFDPWNTRNALISFGKAKRSQPTIISPPPWNIPYS